MVYTLCTVDNVHLDSRSRLNCHFENLELDPITLEEATHYAACIKKSISKNQRTKSLFFFSINLWSTVYFSALKKLSQ